MTDEQNDLSGQIASKTLHLSGAQQSAVRATNRSLGSSGDATADGGALILGRGY